MRCDFCGEDIDGAPYQKDGMNFCSLECSDAMDSGEAIPLTEEILDDPDDLDDDEDFDLLDSEDDEYDDEYDDDEDEDDDDDDNDKHILEKYDDDFFEDSDNI